MKARVPFQEKKSRFLRGFLDIARGCYPKFIYGLKSGRILPVFHFHDVNREYLERHLRYLAENGYETLDSRAMLDFSAGGVYPGDRKVVLTFDDGWKSLWTAAFPLLRKYGMKAVAYIITGRVEDARAVRKPGDSGGSQLATWPELRAMHKSGVIDIQSHTHSHAMIFCDDVVSGFVTPDWNSTPLSRPVIRFEDKSVVTLTGDMAGAPLYSTRSRMSGARRFLDDEDCRRRCIEYVCTHGGADFFRKNRWEEELREIEKESAGRFETDDERTEALRRELVKSRQILRERLQKDEVDQVCLPWGICGDETEKLAGESGYRSAVSDRLFGKRYMAGRSNPFRIMRLKHKYIFRLPHGKGRTGDG